VPTFDQTDKYTLLYICI